MKAPSSLSSFFPTLLRSIATLALALAASAAPAAVVPGELEATSSLNVDVVSSASMSLVSDLSFVEGEVRASSLGSDLELLEDGGELVEVDGHVAGRHFVVRDEGTFLRYIASATMDLAWTRGTAAAGDDVQMTASAGTIFDFEITGAPMKATIKWGDFSSFAPGITLRNTDTDFLFFSYPEDAGTGMQSSVVLPPGNYRLTSGIGSDNTTAATLDNTFAIEFTITEEPEPFPEPDPVRPAEGCHTHPDIFTARAGGDLLATSTPQVLSETDLGNGTTEFRVTTSVENLGNAPWPEVDVALAETVPGEPHLEVLSSLSTFALDANATAGPPPGSETVVRVDTADAATLRASILDGSRFRLSGNEQPVFRYPVRPLGTEDFEPRPSLSPAVSFLSFLEAPLFGSGTIIIEWEPFFTFPLVTLIAIYFPAIYFPDKL